MPSLQLTPLTSRFVARRSTPQGRALDSYVCNLSQADREPGYRNLLERASQKCCAVASTMDKGKRTQALVRRHLHFPDFASRAATNMVAVKSMLKRSTVNVCCLGHNTGNWSARTGQPPSAWQC